jgi:hypothetical protein
MTTSLTAEHCEVCRNILANRQREQRCDGAGPIAPGVHEVEREPQKKDAEGRIMEVVKVRSVHRRIKQVTECDQDGAVGSDVPPPIQEERDGSGGDHHRLE